MCARTKWLTIPSLIVAAFLLYPAPAGAAGPNAASDVVGSSSSEQRWLAADAWLNSPAVQTRLSSGAVAVRTVIDGKASRGTVEAAISIHASAHEIWPFITRCRYAAWLIPGLKSCRILETAPDGSWADIEHVIRYSMFTPAMHSVFRAEFHPPYRMDFHHIGGNLNTRSAAGALFPRQEARRLSSTASRCSRASGYRPSWCGGCCTASCLQRFAHCANTLRTRRQQIRHRT